MLLILDLSVILSDNSWNYFLRADFGNYNVIRGREFQLTLQGNFVGLLSLQAQPTDKNRVWRHNLPEGS